MAGNNYALNVFVSPNDANLSPVPMFAPLQYSLSINGGGAFYVGFANANTSYGVPLSNQYIEMLIDTPSAPPSPAPTGGSNIFKIKVPMSIFNIDLAYVPNFSAFPAPGIYTLNFYIFGNPNYVSLPTIVGVTV